MLLYVKSRSSHLRRKHNGNCAQSITLETNKFWTRDAVNLDISSRCTLACPACARQSISNIPSNLMSEEEFDKYLNHFNRFIFCGQISDPILHPKLDVFLSKVYAADKMCSVHVAATHKPDAFFIKCFKAHPKANWYFGIDGLPEDSHKYRVRQDGKKLFRLMLESRKYIAKSIWQYIIFNYNENDIDKAKELCIEYDLGMSLIKSNRWHTNESLKPEIEDNYLIREKYD